jgi:hypothetical protein
METKLSKIQPNSAKKFYCNICDYNTSKLFNYNTHILSSRHIKNAELETHGNQIKQNSANQFYCKNCDYITSRKSNYIAHINSSRHAKNAELETYGNQIQQKFSQSNYLCEICEKEFKNRSGLWKHKKQHYDYKNDNCCQIDEEIQSSNIDTPNKDVNDNIIDKDLVIMLLKQNNELLQIVKNGTTNNTNSHNTNNSNNTTNNNSKTFNLQFFLNETCKNAMNIEEFVEQIVLNLNDLEETGRIGFAEGITKMITSRLKALDITERPFHCSDIKRETLYIKNENKWEKEEDDKPKLKKAVKQIAGKNMNQIFEWQKVHPDYSDPDTRTSDRYMKMLSNVMSGGTEEETQQNYDKIIKNITKEAMIDKENFSV